MTREAIDRGAELVLWPESAIAFHFEDDRGGAEQVRALAREAGVAILLGSDQIDHGAYPGGTDPRMARGPSEDHHPGLPLSADEPVHEGEATLLRHLRPGLRQDGQDAQHMGLEGEHETGRGPVEGAALRIDQ